MTTFTITLSCDPSPASETARILRALADTLDRLDNLPAHCPLHDANGNKVGFAQCEPVEPDMCWRHDRPLSECPDNCWREL